MRKIFGIFLWGILLTAFGDAVRKVPENRFYTLQYERLQESERGLAVNLFDRLNRMSRQLIPDKTLKRKALTVIAEYGARGNAVPCFAARKERGGRLYLSVPGTLQGMLADRDALSLLCSRMLLARTGTDLSRGDFLRDSWLVAGMLRKTLQDMTPNKTPFSTYFPGAYALARHEVYPSLKSVMNSRLSTADGVIKVFSDEYSELLLLACARANLFQTGFLSEWLENAGNGSSVYEIFLRKTEKEIAVREKRLFGYGKSLSPEDRAEMWFREELHRMLILDTMPAAASVIEKEFLDNQYFLCIEAEKENLLTGNKKFSHRELKKKRTELRTKQSEQHLQTKKFPLEEFVRRYSSMKDPEKSMDEVVSRLLGVGRMISPDLSSVFRNYFHALNRMRSDHTPAAEAAFLKSRNEFLAALEQHIVLERFSAEKEQMLVSFPARYYLTLPVLDSWRRPESTPMRKLALLLEQQAQKAGDR